jgi:hypothetical protein
MSILETFYIESIISSMMNTNFVRDEDFAKMASKELEVILSRIAELEWKPIETAPKDGTAVLLLINDFIDIGRYQSMSKQWATNTGLYFHDISLHMVRNWMPLKTPEEK